VLHVLRLCNLELQIQYTGGFLYVKRRIRTEDERRYGTKKFILINKNTSILYGFMIRYIRIIF